MAYVYSASMSWYTGKGDKGDSKWFDGKDRTLKDDPRFEALGTLDELCSTLGKVRALMNASSGAKELTTIATSLSAIQNDCFTIQAEVAGADKRLPLERVTFLESLIADIDKLLPPPTAFIVPGEDMLSAECDVARTVARRAERRLVTFSRMVPVSDGALAYINRLSSVLYVFARYLIFLKGLTEKNPRYF